MIKKWLRIADLGGDPWVLPIMNAINQGVTAGKWGEIDNEYKEIGLHISTRLNILKIIIKRVRDGWKTFFETIVWSDENIYKNGINAFAIIADKQLLYNLLADLDSFLFETNSCCELMQKYLMKAYIHRGINIQETEIGKTMAKILLSKGQDPKWFRILDKERNLFIHSAAPFIAIDITTDIPELIIMEENIISFDDDSKYITLSDLSSVLSGFTNAKYILQQHIIGTYS